ARRQHASRFALGFDAEGALGVGEGHAVDHHDEVDNIAGLTAAKAIKKALLWTHAERLMAVIVKWAAPNKLATGAPKLNALADDLNDVGLDHQFASASESKAGEQLDGNVSG